MATPRGPPTSPSPNLCLFLLEFRALTCDVLPAALVQVRGEHIAHGAGPGGVGWGGGVQRGKARCSGGAQPHGAVPLLTAAALRSRPRTLPLLRSALLRSAPGRARCPQHPPPPPTLRLRVRWNGMGWRRVKEG